MFQANIWEDKFENNRGICKYPWDKIVSAVNIYYNKLKPKQSSKVLELGFGSGCNLWFCAREGFDCYGVEASKAAVKSAKKWFAQDGLKADLREGLFYPLPFSNNMFDIIIDRGALTCVSYRDCNEAFKEVYRVLKKGGIFFFNGYSCEHTSCVEGKLLESGLSEISSGNLTGVGNLKFYSIDEVQSLSNDNGFKIKAFKHIKEEIIFPEKQIHAEWFVVLQKI